MMKAWKILKAVSVCAVLATLGAAATQGETATAPHLTGVIAFLYCEDFERASRFYGEALGLSKTYDRDGVEVFAVTPGLTAGRSKLP